MAWMLDLSPWALAALCSGIMVAITWLGIVFVRPFLRLLLRRQPGVNDLVSYSSAGFSLLYGLLLGLLSVATYQTSRRSTPSSARRQRRWGCSTWRRAAFPSPCAATCRPCSGTTHSTSSTRTGRRTSAARFCWAVRHG